MTLSFLKMHGLGNDFVVLDARAAAPDLPPERLRRIADRRRGVGCDQVIVIAPPDRNAGGAEDALMRIFNADGSEAQACGNAARCVAFLLMRESGRDGCLLRTRRGLLSAWREPGGGDGAITVDMGAALLDWRDIPLSRAVDTLELPLEPDAAEGLPAPAAVGMGNPHCVFIVPDAEAAPLERLGPRMEHHPLFPERTNVEFISPLPGGGLRLRVWERGAGVTPACGSGACAALVAAVRRGVSPRRAEVVLDGGALLIHWREADGHVLMTGPVAEAFRGWLP